MARRWPIAVATAGTLTAALAAASIAAVSVVAGPAPPAAASVETYPVPTNGVYRVIGRGYGHGHGLSQYGARAAAASLNATAILDFYYPGTATGTASPTAPIRVRLVGAYPTQLQVHGGTGLAVLDGGTGQVYPMTNTRVRYRIVATAAGMLLQYSPDGPHWVTHPLGTGRPHAGPLSFAATGPVQLYLPHGVSRAYDGTLTAVRTGPNTLMTVNALAHDRYVAGVMAREMPASWPAAALRAQAIAARTYAWYERAHTPAGRPWDTCDSTACQVYGGRLAFVGSGVIDLQPATARQAVANTSGLVRTYSGRPIFAQFSSSNGGYSAVGGVPYLAGQPDPYDAASPYHLWTHTLRASDLARCAGLRTITSLTVLARDGHGDWGGRLVLLKFTGTDPAGRPATSQRTGPAVRTCFPKVFRSTYATFW
jgi:SpoIID/LytB domain protein